MMKKFLVSVAVIAALPALSGATPGVLVDSTFVEKSVVATQTPGLSRTDVTNVAGAVATTIVTNAANTTGTVPPGYREITTAMSSHYLGSSDTGLAAAGYYYGLNYAAVAMSGGALSYGWGVGGLSTACGVDTTPRVVVVGYVGQEFEGATNPAAPNDYYAFEPLGTRSTLQKIVGATVAPVSIATINSYKLAGTLGVNTGTATAICQAQGLTNFVQGTITYMPWGNGCSGSELITQYRSGSWVSDTACYNQLMKTMQCWR